MQVWPQGAWFGFTKRRLLRISAGILALFLVFVAWFFYCRYKASEARHLLAEIRTLRIGESTFADTQQLRNRYPKDWRAPEKKCSSDDCDYTMVVDDIPFTSLLNKYPIISNMAEVAADTEALTYLGCQNWMVIAGFVIRKGRVVQMWGAVWVETRGRYWLETDWQYSDTIPNWQLKSIAGMDYHGYKPGKYLIQWNHFFTGNEYGERVGWAVTTSASTTEREEAFEINTNCLTIIRGCHSLRDLRPVVAKYMPEFFDR